MIFKRKLATHAVAAGHAHKAQHKHAGWLKPKAVFWPPSRAERDAEAARAQANVEYWRNLAGR